MTEQEFDELLESIWICRESGAAVTVDQVLAYAHGQSHREMLEQMALDGLIRMDCDQITLTLEGEARASDIIRRHRLAERLFTDVLGLPIDQIEGAACSFEHAVLPELTESLCTLLGHPPECPHGKPIPPGPDCLEGRKKVQNFLVPLQALPCGQRARIAYLRSGNRERLRLLLSMGIYSGIELVLHQKIPMLVIEIDQTEYALDATVAADVYVRIGDQRLPRPVSAERVVRALASGRM